MCSLFETNIKYKMYACMYVFEEKCVCGRESVGFDSGHAFRKKHELTSASNVTTPRPPLTPKKSYLQKYLKWGIFIMLN